ncbi:helix-hairpin-helix domain-containing protein [Chryseobacterium gregarium]|uniref:DNA-directed RNA polymerase subunit alpha C-terminal domain-containing protein n=1 Tax=Chryseobacterium gregarium TaxID=456299 RepID=UPI00040A3837|nr:DNA-directed RNA polymerase subunit alpha C-terminal domain-containing protein [Chryseobacterium gregarium]
MAKCLTSVYAVSHTVQSNFLKGIIAVPARRALEKEKIDSLEKLSGYSEDEIMKLHGFGRNTMNKLKRYMNEQRVSFKDQLF